MEDNVAWYITGTASRDITGTAAGYMEDTVATLVTWRTELPSTVHEGHSY